MVSGLDIILLVFGATCLIAANILTKSKKKVK